MLLFNDAGEITQRISLSREATRVVEIPPDTWHSYVSRKSGTVVIEIKQGTYLLATEEDFLSMAPAENTEEAASYLKWMAEYQ